MVDRSAAEIADSSQGNLTRKHLTTHSGLVFTYLYDGPLLDYLEAGEQPEYVFSNGRRGIRITDQAGEKTPHNTGTGGKRYLLITDRRILYVAGCRDGDESIEYTYENILKVSVADSEEIEFLTTDKKVYNFHQMGATAATVEDAVEYASARVRGTEQEDVDFRKVRETDSASEAETPEKYKPDEADASRTRSSSTSEDASASSGPAFTTRGKNVRVHGNTNEKTKCGRIEVFDDHLRIQQKGRLLSKGWISVQFDEIVDVQVSSLGKWRFMTKRQDVTVTGLGGPTTAKLKRHIHGYLETRRAELEEDVENADQRVNVQSSTADEIAKFAKLKDEGVISEEEFQEKKDELL